MKAQNFVEDPESFRLDIFLFQLLIHVSYPFSLPVAFALSPRMVKNQYLLPDPKEIGWSTAIRLARLGLGYSIFVVTVIVLMTRIKMGYVMNLKSMVAPIKMHLIMILQLQMMIIHAYFRTR